MNIKPYSQNIDTSINPSIYIIILNWNGYEDTLECVQSVSKIIYENYKIIIVDNGSDTDEIDKIVNNFPKINLIKSKTNLGFSGGNNLAIEYS
ncbi:MAG: glycosyltransferase, partial [Ignavibacteria bacterium]|nr:glycosyltransferase [Ignavibacteria bacterium]